MFHRKEILVDKITAREFLERIVDERDKRYEQRFLASDTAVSSALAAAKEAVIKAELASDKRFESVNEFRATLSDQQRTLMPRTEAELLIKTLSDRIDTNTTNITTITGRKSGARDLWGYIIGGAGFASAVIFHFIK